MKLHLETERLLLRPWRLDDASGMFYGWANDPEVTKYMTWNPHQNIEETRSLLKLWLNEYESDPSRINCAIILKENNELIGGIDVVSYLKDDNGVTPVIGYDISRKYWNKGYASEATKKMIEYLFSIGYKQIRIDAMKENIASIRVIEKCGGVYQYTFKDKRVLKGDEPLVNVYLISK